MYIASISGTKQPQCDLEFSLPLKKKCDDNRYGASASNREDVDCDADFIDHGGTTISEISHALDTTDGSFGICWKISR
ncbi:hypothetical protein ACOSQ2_021226 [Xanthoceras sorbifolium]